MSELSKDLKGFFERHAPLEKNDLILVAFSGGPDSTALLAGLADLSKTSPHSWCDYRVHAVHLDHRLDAGSRARANQASRLAQMLNVPFSSGTRPVSALRRRGESLEAVARRVRYNFLEQTRRRLGGRYIATGHHRDDQSETILLRLLFGTGLVGLQGIAPRVGPIVRPLLELPRQELAGYLENAGLEAIEDPSNQDLARPRNRLRHLILPKLLDEGPQLPDRLTRLGLAAAGAAKTLERQLEAVLNPSILVDGVEVDRRRLVRLPEPLLPLAIAWLHKLCGASYPPSGAAMDEIQRQLANDHVVGCDCGDGWRLEGSRSNVDLVLRRPHRRVLSAPPSAFAYTLTVPGEVRIDELKGTFGLRRAPVERWMFSASRRRAALALPAEVGETVTVRNRRPGDRIRPFGCDYRRRLKDVLIDRKIPRDLRDRLPLLCVRDQVAWVPGVTIDDTYRLRGEKQAVVAEFRQP